MILLEVWSGSPPPQDVSHIKWQFISGFLSLKYGIILVVIGIQSGGGTTFIRLDEIWSPDPHQLGPGFLQKQGENWLVTGFQPAATGSTKT